MYINSVFWLHCWFILEFFTNLITTALIFAVLCAFLCAVIQGYSGFGGGLIMVPIMALLFDPVLGIALSALPFFLGILLIIPRSISDVNWSEVLPLSALSGLAILVGQNFLLSSSSENIKIIMGCFIVFIAILLLRNWKYTGKRNIFTSGIVGSSTGLVTGSLGIPGGPIMVMYFLSESKQPQVQRANILMTGFINTTVFILGFIYHGIFEQKVILQSGILVPFFIAGSFLGQYLFVTIPTKWFLKACSGMLILIGLIVVIA